MEYLYLIIVTIAFSLVGTFVKLARVMVSPEIISFMRLAVGVLFLYVLSRIRGIRPKVHFAVGMMWIGGALKALNYITENYALAQGMSYGNIIVWPTQTVLAMIAGVLVFREKVRMPALIGVAVCMIGIGLVAWNGQPMKVFTGTNLPLTLLMIVSGFGAMGFLVVQKLMLSRMSVLDSNLTMFCIGSLFTLIFVPVSGEIHGPFSWLSILGLVMLGVITGGGFMLTALALRRVPLYISTVIQSTAVLFTLLWGVLFFHEPMSVYLITGSIVFIIGMLLINLSPKNPKTQETE